MTNPVLLCILDGWGYREEKENNAIELANSPNWHRFVQEYPTAFIETSGLKVGLSEGQMGNSEVGHTNLGAGRIVMQDLPMITEAIKDKSIFKKPAFINLIKNLKTSGGICHLMGLVSEGGVHSHQGHFAPIIKELQKNGIKTFFHAFLDGRDTPPRSAKEFIAKLEAELAPLNCPIVTVSGRYYAMDRDNRWDRIEKAYINLTEGKGEFSSPTPQNAIDIGYARGENDEFINPTKIGNYNGMNDGDSVFVLNFRADRVRQILFALGDKNFQGFPRNKIINFSDIVGITQYSTEHDKFMHTVFESEPLNNIFGEVVSRQGLKQLRIAETEKYAHVTFFFNGGEEKMFAGEERILVPSPKVATYDLQPEMSAFEVCDKLITAIKSKEFAAIICNFANGDMVGHTGILSAAIKAVETIDICLSKIEKAIKETGYTMLLIADHGNCEKMWDEVTNSPHTAHTVGKIKMVLVNPPQENISLKEGKLADIAPTMLEIMGIEKPKDMTGVSLLVKD